MMVMKCIKIFKLLSAVLVLMLVQSCSDRLHTIFTDYYVSIKNEDGAASSVVDASQDNLLVTYYIYLVAPILDEDVVVNYSVEPGDGLKEGVDYKLTSASGKVTISPGITRMPVRVTFLRHEVDPQKDNTLTLKLTSCSNPSIRIGYPGPDALFSSHIVTKRNF